MFLSAVAAILIAQAPKPETPITDVFARDGKIVVIGKEFEATASRLSISPDGKRVLLLGGDEPVQLRSRVKGGNGVHLVMGQKITLDTAAGTLEVIGAGLVEVRQK
jgi:hypothetical protein